MLYALSLDLFAVLFGGAVAMIPVYARDILQVGATGFGWLNAANDVGAICIVIPTLHFPFHRQQGKNYCLLWQDLGTCIIIFALSKIFWLSFAALADRGYARWHKRCYSRHYSATETPDHMRGRVMSVNSMFINSSNELGQFESGLAARLLGVVPSVVLEDQ